MGAIEGSWVEISACAGQEGWGNRGALGKRSRSETGRPALTWHVGGLREASVRLVEGSGVKEGQKRVNTGAWLGALMEVRGAEGLTGKAQAWEQG